MITVIGAGLMGRSIAVELARFGYDIELVTRIDINQIVEVSDTISKIGEKYFPDQINEIKSKIRIKFDYDNLKNSELVIESITENLEAKRSLMRDIEKHLLPTTLLASNTSSLSISKIFEGVPNPERCFGLHFFNPVQVMKLVEISYTPYTSSDTLEYGRNLAKEIGKESVIVKDSTGFIVNRLLIPMINEAIKLYDEGIATKEDIDKAMKLGANHPVGPFKLSDLIGNDITLSILEELYEDTTIESHEIARSLKEIVRDKKLGRKTSEGFYSYHR